MTTHDDALPALTDDEILAEYSDAQSPEQTPEQFALRFGRAVEQRVLAALAAREGEPVAWRYRTDENPGKWHISHVPPAEAREWNCITEAQPLYAAPPAPSQSKRERLLALLTEWQSEPPDPEADRELARLQEALAYSRGERETVPSQAHEAMRAALEALTKIDESRIWPDSVNRNHAAILALRAALGGGGR